MNINANSQGTLGATAELPMNSEQARLRGKKKKVNIQSRHSCQFTL